MDNLSNFWDNVPKGKKSKLTKVSFDVKEFLNNFDISRLPEGKKIESVPFAPIDYKSFYRAFKFAFNKVNKKEFNKYSYGSDTDLTPFNLFKTLTYYFFRDERFYKSELLSNFTNPSLDKGFIIAGVKGIGKTDTMKAFNELFTNADKYEIKNINNKIVKLETYFFIRFQFMYGYDLIDMIKKDKLTESMHVKPLYIDDLLREEDDMVYGKKINFTNFKMIRYDNRAKTFASMNYIESETPEDIFNSYKKKYGSPLDDRFFESFNLIELKGIKSFRR